MVGFDGQVKVVDFGIAKAADRAELTAPGQIKGKIAYMSPEQIYGNPLDGRSDVFSLGIVLWEMLTRRRLFKAENTAAASQRVLTMQVRAPSLDQPSIHPELDAIVLRALNRDLTRRHGSALELHEELNAFLARRYPGYLYPEIAKFMTALFKEHLQEEAEHVESARAILPTVTPRHHQVASQTNEEPKTTADRRPPTMTGASSHAADDDRTQHSDTLYADALPIQTVTSNVKPSSPIWMWAGVALILFGGLYVIFRPTEVQSHMPTDISGLVAWFRAENLSLDAGAVVSKWSDSGPMRAVASQETAVFRPHYFPKSTDGPAFVRFDGKDDFLVADGVATDLRRAKGLTAIWVVRLRRAKVQYVWSVHGEDRLRDVIRGGYSRNSRVRTKLDPKSGSAYHDADEMVALDTWGMYSLVIDQEEGRLYAAGEEILRAEMRDAPRFFESTYFSIGQEWDDVGPSDFFAGDLVELIVFDRNLYNDERRSIERYLAETYGLGTR